MKIILVEVEQIFLFVENNLVEVERKCVVLNTNIKC